MANLAAALLAATARRDAVVDVGGERRSHAEVRSAALRTAALLRRHGVGPGSPVALCAANSPAFVVAWMGAVLAGAEVALVNASYPQRLRDFLLGLVRPEVVLGEGPAGVAPARPARGASLWDIRGLADGRCTVDGVPVALPARASESDAAGGGRARGDVAGYMHTSGSTGWPKFCAQSHAYYLNLAAFAAEALRLEAGAVVYNPLPLYHVNPLGYCLVPALLNGCHFASEPRFSARSYWRRAGETGATTLVLHQPLVRILKKQGTPARVPGTVRLAFLADAGFQRTFAVPETVGAYGSTEAGGLTSYSRWRHGQLPRRLPPEGTSCVVGTVRQGMELSLAADGEILVRESEAGHLASHYVTDGGRAPLHGEDGWFHTGDVARVDVDHGTVFVGRRQESIRVRGEFVPIPYVEEVLEALPGVVDAAVGVEASGGEDRLVAYLHCDALPARTALEAGVESLPRFMRPVAVRRVRAIPRTGGVGKVARAELAHVEVLEAAGLRT